MKKTNEDEKSIRSRIFARQLAKELSNADLEKVMGGDVPIETVSRCAPYGDDDCDVAYEPDPDATVLA